MAGHSIAPDGGGRATRSRASQRHHRGGAFHRGADQRAPTGVVAMRLVAAVGFLLLAGCAGMKLGGGYKFDTREFFLQLERPLEPGLKK